MIRQIHYLDWATVGRESNDGAAVGVEELGAKDALGVLRRVICLTAKEFRCPAERIVLTDSTTQGLDLSFEALIGHKPEVVMVTDCVHPSAKASAERFVARVGQHGLGSCQLRVLSTLQIGADEGVQRWLEILDEQMREIRADRVVLLIEHVDYLRGVRSPINAIYRYVKARRPSWVLIVDGAQASGIFGWKVPSDVWYAGNYHKYIGAPAGTGFLVCPRPSLNILPQWAWARSLEGLICGVSHTPTENIAAWHKCWAQLSMLCRVSVSKRIRCVHALQIFLKDELGDLPVKWLSPLKPAKRSTIVTLQLPPFVDTYKVIDCLLAKGILVNANSLGLRIALRHDSRRGAVTALAKALRTLAAC